MRVVLFNGSRREKGCTYTALSLVAGELKAAGIENFIHVRCNVLETMKEYNQKLGI